MNKNSKQKKFPLLSIQILDVYSSTYDKPYFERRPLAWDSDKKHLIHKVSGSCKFYWFNVCIVVMVMNLALAAVLLRRQYLYGSNTAWMVSFFPVLGSLIVSAIFLTVMTSSYWASELVELVANLVSLERRLLNG